MKTIDELVVVGFPQSSVVIDMLEIMAKSVSECRVVLPERFLNHESPNNVPHIIAVGLDLELRQEVINCVDKDQYELFTYIDTNSVVSTSAMISPGCFVAPFCFVGAKVHLERHVIMAPYSMVHHNSRVGTGSILHPGSTVAGSTNIGKFCRLSLKSTVIDHLDICDHVQLGANAMLTKNVVEPGRYLGNPARKIVTAPVCHL